MKILRLTPHFYYTPDVVDKWIVRMDQMGGMQTQIYRQALALSKHDVAQTILPIAMPNAPKIWRLTNNIEVIRGNVPMLPIKSKVRGTVGLNFYWGLGVIGHIIKYKIKNCNFDVLHAHCSGVAAPLVIGIVAKKVLGKPLLYTVHCCRVSTYHPMSKLDELLNKTVIRIEKYCLKNADQIITLTERTKQIICKEYRIEKNKISVIPDVIDFEDFTKEVTIKNICNFKTRFNIKENETIISFVGRIAYEKGCFVLLDAFSKLEIENCKLFFFGDGNERRMLENKIKEYGLEDRCIVTGYLPNTDIPFAISSSDILVMPSLHEEFGGLLLEIAAVGKPVIASDVGGIPTLVKDGQTGVIFKSNNSEELAKKIEYAVNHKEEMIEIGNHFKKDLQSRFSFVKNIEEIKKIYKNLKEK